MSGLARNFCIQLYVIMNYQLHTTVTFVVTHNHRTCCGSVPENALCPLESEPLLLTASDWYRLEETVRGL